MKRAFSLSFAVCLISTAIGQDRSRFDASGISQTSLAYHTFRLVETVPPYSLSRVKTLVAQIKKNNNDDVGTAGLTEAKFRSLSIRAKFTYCMIYGENFSQNCDGMPAFLNEEHRIFAHPSQPFGDEQDWSDRQRNFLHANKTAVKGLIRSSIKSGARVGTNFKKAILEINAVQLIPDLIESYKKTHQDLDILSTLSLLMKHGNFPLYMSSPTFKGLYGINSNYQASIPFSKEAEKAILDDAQLYASTYQQA